MRDAVMIVVLGLAFTRPVAAQVDFPVSCNAAAQRGFNRAVTLLHHMTYPAARTAFERVLVADQHCAMAHWGVAMTLFQPLWPTRPGLADLQQGWRAVEAARRLKPITERERQLVETMAAFFTEPASADYWARIRRWEAALERVHQAFPDDPEITVFYALAHLAAAPSDSGARRHSERAAALLLSVHARSPEHPGAHHYLVHANDTPGREGLAPAIVANYEAMAPRNPHALHMPTHIHVRMGDWNGVIRGNLLAADAALEYPAGDFVWDEFPHAVEYLVYAHLQRGDDSASARQLKRLLDTPRLQPTFKTAFHLASIRARHALERRDWAAAAVLPVREPAALPWDRFPWPEAVTWFARGLGAAHTDQPGAATEAVARLNQLEATAVATNEPLFAANIRMLRLELSAWLAHAGGDSVASIAMLREAAALEQATPKHPVTPAPTLPALELLGDMLLEQLRPTEALAAYRQSLDLYPRRFNSLAGAARAAAAARDTTAARGYQQALLELAVPGATRTGFTRVGQQGRP